MNLKSLKSRYHSMIQRCYNPKNPGYHYWGGRGIKVCERWLDRANLIPKGQRGYARAGLQNFIDDMGPSFDPVLELDRTDNDGDYTPDNCGWVTEREQMLNRRGNGCLGHKRSMESRAKQSKTIKDKREAHLIGDNR